MSDTTGGTGPGWYPDATRPGTLRYWDGQAGTDHTSPAGSTAGPAGGGYAVGGGYGGGPAGGAWGAPATKTDGFAIAAFVLSLPGALLLSVVFALVARGRIKRSQGTLAGKGLTTAALVISGLWVVVLGILVAVIASGVLDHRNVDDYDGEERDIAAVIDGFEEESAEEVCSELVTEGFRATSGGPEGCVRRLDVGDQNRADIDVTGISISGDTATVTADELDEQLVFTLVREGGTWRVDEIRLA